MSLTRVAIPTPTAPATTADYQAILTDLTAIIAAMLTGTTAAVDSSTIKAGSVLSVGGVLYKAVTDEAITGTPSAFVKITPSGATAAVAFVSSLAGVSWSDAFKGYYDGSGNLYLFDEATAIQAGTFSAPKTSKGKIDHLYGALTIKGALTGVTDLTMSGALTGVTDLTMSGDLSVDDITMDALIANTANFSGIITAGAGISESAVTLKRAVYSIGAWNMDSNATKNVNTTGIQFQKIRDIKAIIIRDDNLTWTWLDLGVDSSGNGIGKQGDALGNTPTTQQVTLVRLTSGVFDNTNFDDAVMNRGYMFITYEG